MCTYLVIDYFSKWVEFIDVPTNYSNSVMRFFHKNIFTRFGTPYALISYEGYHFDCKFVANGLNKNKVKHKIAIAYHP